MCGLPGENGTLLLSRRWPPSLHPAACMQAAFANSPSRTHLCREDELTDDVCCVLTPIGEPHDLRDSFAANPIICGERGKD